MSQIRGRFNQPADKLAEDYTASINTDWRLYPYDIAGSIAHARMLGKQGIIPQPEAEIIVKALNEIRQELDQDKFEFKAELEDIHMSIEARLIEKIGEVGGKLHTARSRNDQVALDMRLFTKDAISRTLSALREFQQALINLADANKDAVIPGYTHLQRAQPVLLGHALLAYVEMLQRDYDRLADARKRVNVCPLGSGAVAGTSIPLDRKSTAEQLAFSQISGNSIDATCDRDFLA